MQIIESEAQAGENRCPMENGNTACDVVSNNPICNAPIPHIPFQIEDENIF